MLLRAPQAAALLRRGFVLPDDIQRLPPHVLAHRVMLTSESKYGGTTKRDVIIEIVNTVKVPT